MQAIKPLGEHPLLLLLLQFGLLLLVARVLGEIAMRFNLPSVVGELLAGFVLGPTLFGALAPGLFEHLFPKQPEQVHLLEVVSWLGVIMLLILTGLETDVGLIARKGKKAAAISLGGIAVPFATGLALGFLIPKEFVGRPDARLVFALFIGTAMSISAIPVIAKVLMEMKIIRRDIGQVTLAAGMMDDTVGWILLSVVAGLARSGKVNLGTAGQAVLSVLAVLLVSMTIGKRLVRGLIRQLDNRVGGDTVKITALMVLALGLGSLTHALKLEAVLGAFITGILVGQVKRFDERARHSFEQITLGVFAPVFFAVSGLRVDLSKLFKPSVLAVGMLVLSVAILGKFIGAYVGARSTKLSHWEALSLGAGMNARGAMEIIVATIGLTLGILTAEMYTIILLTAIVTSLMAPPLLRWTLGKVEMGQEEKERLESEDRRQDSFVANLKRVLLPTVGGPGARVAAEIVGLMVGEEDVEVTSMYLETASNGQGKESDDDPERVLERVEDRLQLPSSENQRRVVCAEDADRGELILEEARKGYDLLVLAGAGRRTPQSGPMFNEPLDELIQESPCPLLVVSTETNRDGEGDESLSLERILLPIWGSKSDRVGAEVAFSIAKEGDVVVDVLHVVDRDQHRSRTGSEEGLHNAVEIGEEMVEKVAEFGRSMGARVHTEVVVARQVEEAVIDHARHHADLIVLETNRAPVTQRAFFGHHVDYVLREAPCPVVVVGMP